MQYFVSCNFKEEEVIFDEAWKVAEYLSEKTPTDLFDDYLNERYGEVEICGLTYSAAYALENIDPTAYRCEFADYTDYVSRNIESEVDYLGDDDTYEWDDYTVYAKDDEIEDDEDDEEEDDEDYEEDEE